MEGPGSRREEAVVGDSPLGQVGERPSGQPLGRTQHQGTDHAGGNGCQVRDPPALRETPEEPDGVDDGQDASVHERLGCPGQDGEAEGYGEEDGEPDPPKRGRSQRSTALRRRHPEVPSDADLQGRREHAVQGHKDPGQQCCPRDQIDVDELRTHEAAEHEGRRSQGGGPVGEGLPPEEDEHPEERHLVDEDDIDDPGTLGREHGEEPRARIGRTRVESAEQRRSAGQVRIPQRELAVAEIHTHQRPEREVLDEIVRLHEDVTRDCETSEHQNRECGHDQESGVGSDPVSTRDDWSRQGDTDRAVERRGIGAELLDGPAGKIPNRHRDEWWRMRFDQLISTKSSSSTRLGNGIAGTARACAPDPDAHVGRVPK